MFNYGTAKRVLTLWMLDERGRGGGAEDSDGARARFAQLAPCRALQLAKKAGVGVGYHIYL